MINQQLASIFASETTLVAGQFLFVAGTFPSAFGWFLLAFSLDAVFAQSSILRGIFPMISYGSGPLPAVLAYGSHVLFKQKPTSRDMNWPDFSLWQ
jgi:hypothetical protein